MICNHRILSEVVGSVVYIDPTLKCDSHIILFVKIKLTFIMKTRFASQGPAAVFETNSL